MDLFISFYLLDLHVPGIYRYFLSIFPDSGEWLCHGFNPVCSRCKPNGWPTGVSDACLAWNHLVLTNGQCCVLRTEEQLKDKQQGHGDVTISETDSMVQFDGGCTIQNVSSGGKHLIGITGNIGIQIHLYFCNSHFEKS